MENINFILNKYHVGAQKSPIELWCTRLGTLPKLFRQLGFKTGAEIGVHRGKFSEALIRNNPALKLFCVDAWETFGEQRIIEPQDLLDKYLLETKDRLAPYDCQIIRDWSMNAVKKFADASLDFVYIDANHDYEYVKEDIREWSKKVRKGGIVAGHDYIDRFNDIEFGVKQAVGEWIAENKIPYLFLLVKELHANKCPSWFYVKD